MSLFTRERTVEEFYNCQRNEPDELNARTPFGVLAIAHITLVLAIA